jgi:hypothetical protein
MLLAQFSISFNKKGIYELRYWIYCDPSLALPLITEQSIKIIVTTGHGHFLIPHLLRAHPSAKNLVETVKNIVANQKN